LQALPQRPPGLGERDVLSPSVFGVALSLHKPALLEQVDVADEMASLDVEAIGELVLRQRPEVGERGENGSMRQPQVMLGQPVQQETVADPRDIARKVRRQREQARGPDLVIHETRWFVAARDRNCSELSRKE
jgi:hypothetical protein